MKYGVAVASVLLTVATVQAVPTLQLDGAGGVYNDSTDTVDIPGATFLLHALLDPTKENALTDQYFLSAALVPKVSAVVSDFGSFTIGGTTYTLADADFGTPPLEEKIQHDLPPHGIFPSRFIEIPFDFSSANKAVVYNVQDDPGEFAVAPSGAASFLLYETFSVDVGNLLDSYDLHFDLYGVGVIPLGKKKSMNDITDFAPFSHDAESINNHVPDTGGTVLLCGLAVLCLGAIQSRRSL